MATIGYEPRRAAHRLICLVAVEGRLLSELLPDELSELAPPERARAQRLAAETLRWMDRADRLLGPHLKQMPPPPVMLILRMAVVEMAQDGAASHGVVNDAVRLAKSDRSTARMAGLVNAVLRRVDITRWPDLPAPRLPKKLRARLLAAWQKRAVEQMEVAHAAGAPLDLTPRDGKAEVLAERVNGIALSTGSVRLNAKVQVTNLPDFEAGSWWVQDAAAALPARVLAPRRAERVADLCAAPGGKTMQLAAAGAKVTALDISGARMARVAENLSRTALEANLVVHDLLDWASDPFDAVLLDAPCSATGTIRRHPDLPHAKGLSDFSDLVQLQAKMLDRAVDQLRPGGRLVYCTCSLLPEEGEEQVAQALSRHTRLVLDPAALDRPGIDLEWTGPLGLRLRPDYWPELGGMDGFFIAALRKAA